MVYLAWKVGEFPQPIKQHLIINKWFSTGQRQLVCKKVMIFINIKTTLDHCQHIFFIHSYKKEMVTRSLAIYRWCVYLHKETAKLFASQNV